METIRVAAAIIQRDGRIFCAHRQSSHSGPGWEFPGGRIEAGETSEQALRREMAEELSCSLSTTWLLDTVEHDYPQFHLVMGCYVCELAPGSSPELKEHDEARWLDRDGLLDLDWLPADRKVVSLIGASWDMIFAATHL